MSEQRIAVALFEVLEKTAKGEVHTSEQLAKWSQQIADQHHSTLLRQRDELVKEVNWLLGHSTPFHSAIEMDHCCDGEEWADRVTTIIASIEGGET